jgi:hypothetical protein
MFLILDEMERSGTEIEVRHVKAHVTDKSKIRTEHQLNEKADKAAKAARDPEQLSANHCPWPTFALDKFTVWDEEKGYIEADLYRHIKKAFRQIRKETLFTSDYITQLNTTPYEQNTHSEYMYQRATADYSIRTQALIRGKALHTNRKTAMMFPGTNTPMCPDCPYSIENEHHIFVECKTYETIRETAIQELAEKIEKMKPSGQFNKESLMAIATTLFRDNPQWPSGETRYYVGMVPPLDALFSEGEAERQITDPNEVIEEDTWKTTRKSIGKLLHARAVRTAGHIWSVRMRNRHTKWRQSREETTQTTDEYEHDREDIEDERELEEDPEDPENGGPFIEWVEDMETPQKIRRKRIERTQVIGDVQEDERDEGIRDQTE